MTPTKKMDRSTSISSSYKHETGMHEQTRTEQSDLRLLDNLYGVLRKGSAYENLDEQSKALTMKILDDATQQALLRQAQMLLDPLKSPALERKLFIQPDRPTRGYLVPLLNPIASPSLSLSASERSRRLNVQGSIRSRDHHHAHGDRLLARLASNRSSRTALTQDRLASHRSSRAAMPEGATVDDEFPCSDRRGGPVPRRTSGRGDRSSLERGNRRRSISSERPAAQEGAWRLHRAPSVARRVGAEGSSTCRLGRLDSGLSGSVAPCHGFQRAGAAGSKLPSSTASNADVRMRSRIRPNRDLTELCRRRAGEAEEKSPLRGRRRNITGAASVSMRRSSRPRRALNRIDSGSTYSSSSSSSCCSSDAASSYPSRSPRELYTSSASASSSSSPSLASPRGKAQQGYEFQASGAYRLRRRRERQERREGRLRRIKNRLAMVFHHRQDHHHHHHSKRSGSQVGRPSRRDHHHLLPWRYLGGIFHRVRNTTNRTVLRVAAKRRGSDGQAHAPPRHFWGMRRPAPTRAGMKLTGSRVQAKKSHWWQRMRRRRGRKT